MNSFGINLLLAIAWMALTGTVTLGGLLVGLVIGFVALWLTEPLIGDPRYHNRIFAWIKLSLLFLRELIISSIQVIVDIITPGQSSQPALVEIPLDIKSDLGILMLTNFITLTPGTLSLNVNAERDTLVVHAMFAADPDELRHSIKTGVERWVIDAVEGW